MSVLRRLRGLGPGLLVAAAFIGPGTVTTATVAGAEFGYALLWAVVFSVIATIVLQEMSARLGLVSRDGLGEALRTTFSNRIVRGLCIGLVIGAIAFGAETQRARRKLSRGICDRCSWARVSTQCYLASRQDAPLTSMISVLCALGAFAVMNNPG